jgi:hypothetical protein
MAEKTDYSPFDSEAPELESRRRRRFVLGLLTFSHALWIYALVVAGIILLVIYLTGGFGEGSNPR